MLTKVYSNLVKGKVTSITFPVDEIKFLKKHLISGYKAEIKKLNNTLEEIENDPNNEGQANYLEKTKLYFDLIKEYNINIKELENSKNNFQID